MIDKTKPMLLGDIFSNGFTLIGNTILRNLIIASTFLIPAGILLAFGFEGFFKNLLSMANAAESTGVAGLKAELAGDLFLGIFAVSFSALLFYLAYTAVFIGACSAGFTEAEGNKITLEESFSRIFSITYAKCIGLGLLLAAAVFVYASVATISGIIISLISKDLGVAFIFLAVFAFIGLIIYIRQQYDFAMLNIIYSGDGIIKSISQSFYLLKNYWWRTFGILLLIPIIIKFATSVVATPITFIFEWNFISDYMRLISSGGSVHSDPATTIRLLKSVGFVMGIILTVNNIIQLLVYPQFRVAVFMDLKIRKGDFHVEENITSDVKIEPDIMPEGESPIEQP